MNTLDDDRRDVAVLGNLSAAKLNAMYERVPDDDPFEVSGDAIARHNNESGTGGPAKNSPDAADPNPLEGEQTMKNDTPIVPQPTDTTPVEREWEKFEDPTYKPIRHMAGCVPSLCTSHGGPDVAHQGPSRRFERVAETDGESYFLEATPMRLEERGYGYTTPWYVDLQVGSNGERRACLSIELDDLETMADWFCALAERVRKLGDEPGLDLRGPSSC
ncbi:hypothetical protein DFO66_10721 [Brevibacterium sanguinis]|uniref:Uncharacterized protein n=2 Tax=Brevibacterium TaxID=1696 RepID=A0A366IKA0_9MICO|nr:MULTISPECIES: hypothetical protein [Brevibacterium]RBP64149.1 hypothetical protein DFO66_10721 [Brevibacterium sanguinis]RBP71559.1 hypothetical protein DFO65_105163 [Brevibacterium celere]